MGLFQVTINVQADTVFGIPQALNAKHVSVVDLHGVTPLDDEAQVALDRARELFAERLDSED